VKKRQTPKLVVETHIIAQDQEIQKCAFCQQSDTDAVLGLMGPSLSTTMIVVNMHSIVLCLKRS